MYDKEILIDFYFIKPYWIETNWDAKLQPVGKVVWKMIYW